MLKVNQLLQPREHELVFSAQDAQGELGKQAVRQSGFTRHQPFECVNKRTAIIGQPLSPPRDVAPPDPRFLHFHSCLLFFMVLSLGVSQELFWMWHERMNMSPRICSASRSHDVSAKSLGLGRSGFKIGLKNLLALWPYGSQVNLLSFNILIYKMKKMRLHDHFKDWMSEVLWSVQGVLLHMKIMNQCAL